MKVEIEEFHAVATWTWNAEDDSCGICRHVIYHLLFEIILYMLLLGWHRALDRAQSVAPPLQSMAPPLPDRLSAQSSALCGISRHYVVFSECTHSFHILQAAIRWLLPRLQNAGGRLPYSVGRV